MPRNYDTTTHKPYPRITRVEVTYAESGVPSIEYIEQMAIVDADGKVQHLATQPLRQPAIISTRVPDSELQRLTRV